MIHVCRLEQSQDHISWVLQGFLLVAFEALGSCNFRIACFLEVPSLQSGSQLHLGGFRMQKALDFLCSLYLGLRRRLRKRCILPARPASLGALCWAANSAMRKSLAEAAREPEPSCFDVFFHSSGVLQLILLSSLPAQWHRQVSPSVIGNDTLGGGNGRHLRVPPTKFLARHFWDAEQPAYLKKTPH